MSDLEQLVRSIVRDELAKAKPANDVTEFLSTTEAAEFASVAPGTIRRWIREGKLRDHRAGRLVRVLRTDLEKLLKEPWQVDSLTPEQRARREFG